MVGWIDVLTRTELAGEMIKQSEWNRKNKGLEWFACVFIRQRECKAGALRIACARLGPSANREYRSANRVLGWCRAPTHRICERYRAAPAAWNLFGRHQATFHLSCFSAVR